MADFGLRQLDARAGFLEGWSRLGVGIRPPDMQRAYIVDRGVDKLQFDFNKSYGDAPRDLSFLRDFPTVPALQCDAHFGGDGEIISSLGSLISFRDRVYNRTGVDWTKLEKLQDLSIEDYRGKSHPDYDIFQDLRWLSTSHLPKRYSTFDDFSCQKIEALNIYRSRIKSFQGLENFKSLTSLSLVGCRLFDAGAVKNELPSITDLTLAFCPSVQSLEFVRFMPNLRSLRLEKTGPLVSFEPIRAHPALEVIMGPPLRGAKISKELLASVPKLEFVSPSHLDH